MSEDAVLNNLKGLKSKDNDIRWTSINNLRKYLQANPNPTDFRFRMIVKSLLPFTKAPEDNIRENALGTLLEAIEDSKSVGSLVNSALSDPSPGIRSLALEWLNDKNHPQLKTQAIKALSDPAEVVRKTAMDIVVARQIEGVETQLLRLLESESGGLRRAIIYALGKMKTPRAISTLIEIMRNPDYDDWTRNQAGSALEHMGGRELIGPFIENLIDPNDYVRESAAAFLSKNEQEIVSVVMSTGRVDLIAFLQYATDTTKQNFDSTISTLTTQMSFAIKDLQTRLLAKDKFDLSELTAELQSNIVAVKVLTEKILALRLIPLSNNTYLTETGLKRLLTAELEEKRSIYIPTLRHEDPFNQLTPEILEEVISTISNSHRINSEFFLTNEVFSRISSEFQNTGILNLITITEEIHQSTELISRELIPVLNPSNEGWYNSHNEYMTKKFLQSKLEQQINRDSIISLDNFLTQIGNPKIKFSFLKEIIEDQFQGSWLEDIKVFLEMTEFQKLRDDSAGIDESRVSHLLPQISMDFPMFLQSLQKILDIKTYQTRDGQLITLENLHPQLQQHIIGKGYLSIPEFLREVKLDKMANLIKPVILDYITQEFSGSTTPDSNYFFAEDLIDDVTNEIEAKTRINFKVLAFKMDLAEDILTLIVTQILFVRGFTNSIGEFVTEKGIDQEIQGILEFREEFTLQELLEILEIIKDKKKELIVRDLISDDNNLLISQDKEVVITQKGALNKVIHYIKQPAQQTREMIPWEEISHETNISKVDLRAILDSLIQNNLLPGTIANQGYYL
ncbi:MAG: HEAT repeat domain-containing protein [Candidatus Heimdallarchaeota archaeon]|nr:MAG: HEAT repeat domain-containing protein [Candidatus Heimdallarchaeota archaeon]